MREIKFRAWDGEKFIYFGPTSLIIDAVEGDLHELYSLLRTGNFEPDRYTVLKDKNGVEIYEGDIVKNGKPVVVNFDNGHYFAGGSFLSPSLNTMVEVIGNIYENPELLDANS